MGAVAAYLVISLLVMLLWNALMPELFGLSAIGYLQAVGLLILSRLLFSGISGKKFIRAGGRHSRRNRMVEQWMEMGREERFRFMEEMGRRRGHHPHSMEPHSRRAAEENDDGERPSSRDPHERSDHEHPRY